MVTCSSQLFLEFLAEAFPFNQPFLSVTNTQRKDNVCDITYIDLAVVVLGWNHTQNNYFKN